MRDALSDALNAPAGRLAEVLMKRVRRGDNGEEMPVPLQERFDRLASAPGRVGSLARVRFAAEVSFLFEKAPAWTVERILPLFYWNSPDAPSAWNARKYSKHIGSPSLFELTKEPFLELFSRPEMADDDLRVYGNWLAVIMIANCYRTAEYPISPVEARSALRKAGARALSGLAHGLALEMGKTRPDDKVSKWRNIVGAVFQAVWPLDVELQSASTSHDLVQILRGSGNAFPEAAEAIIPFIRPLAPREQTAVVAISHWDDAPYISSPEKIVDLLTAVVGEAPPRSVRGLKRTLDRIVAHAPELVASRKIQKLAILASDF